MAHKSYRAESRRDYGTGADALTHEQIQLGALLRIADATELMAKRHAELLSEVEHLQKVARDRLRTIGELERRVSALRGVLTRNKKRARATDNAMDRMRDALEVARLYLEEGTEAQRLVAEALSKATKGGAE